MFVDKAGEHIADIMTMNRGLSGIPSASSILDTSNYTFQAITYGKDAEGFRNHAHKIISPSADGFIKVVSYGPTSFSGYTTSSTAAALEFYYKLLPQSPSPLDTRLETKSTLPNYVCGVPDVGHCLNSIMDPSLSAYAHLIGCFPAGSGTYFKILDTSNNVIYTSAIQSYYNSFGMMDSKGYLNFLQGPLSTQNLAWAATEFIGVTEFSGGVMRICDINNFPNGVELKWLLTLGDAAGLNLFGGAYHLGLWCLDIKEMLRLGYNPPYNFNPLNNIRKYKLFAKKTFNKDLIYYEDDDSFKLMFVDSIFSNNRGIVFRWKLRFA